MASIKYLLHVAKELYGNTLHRLHINVLVPLLIRSQLNNHIVIHLYIENTFTFKRNGLDGLTPAGYKIDHQKLVPNL